MKGTIMSDDRKTFTATVIMFILFIFIITADLGLEAPVGRALNMPPPEIGDDPPWYYIQRDFGHGVVSFLELITISLVCLVGWRFARQTAFTLAWVTVIFKLPPAIMSVVIYLRCPSLLSDTTRVSPWPTFDAYMADRTEFWVIGVVGAGLILLLFMARRIMRAKEIQAGTP
jgi:hypothetical protein